MQRPSRDTLLQLAKDDPEAIVDLAYKLFYMIESLQGKVEELEAKVCALQKNSRNSSKPPSSDQHNSNPKGKKKVSKGKGGRKPGGQKGHKGSTLQKAEKPDHIVHHHLEGTCPCGQDLREVGSEGYVDRQVFDLPAQIRIESTEHRAHYGTCPCCGKKVRAQFPGHVNAPVQYGQGVRTWVTYLHAYQLLPCEWLVECFEDLFGWRPSPGTISNILENASGHAAPAAELLKEQISNAEYIHLDETSLNLGGKKHWL